MEALMCRSNHVDFHNEFCIDYSYHYDYALFV